MGGSSRATPHTLAELHGLSPTARAEYWNEFRRWLFDWFIPTHAFEWPYTGLSVGRQLHCYAWDTNRRRGRPKTGREESRLLWGTSSSRSRCTSSGSGHAAATATRTRAPSIPCTRKRRSRRHSPTSPVPPRARRLGLVTGIGGPPASMRATG